MRAAPSIRTTTITDWKTRVATNGHGLHLAMLSGCASIELADGPPLTGGSADDYRWCVSGDEPGSTAPAATRGSACYGIARSRAEGSLTFTELMIHACAHGYALGCKVAGYQVVSPEQAGEFLGREDRDVNGFGVCAAWKLERAVPSEQELEEEERTGKIPPPRFERVKRDVPASCFRRPAQSLALQRRLGDAAARLCLAPPADESGQTVGEACAVAAAMRLIVLDPTNWLTSKPSADAVGLAHRACSLGSRNGCVFLERGGVPVDYKSLNAQWAGQRAAEDARAAAKLDLDARDRASQLVPVQAGAVAAPPGSQGGLKQFGFGTYPGQTPGSILQSCMSSCRAAGNSDTLCGSECARLSRPPSSTDTTRGAVRAD